MLAQGEFLPRSTDLWQLSTTRNDLPAQLVTSDYKWSWLVAVAEGAGTHKAGIGKLVLAAELVDKAGLDGQAQ